MPRLFTLSAGARLLGVSTSTLSRRPPADRVRQGQAARLSLEELMGVAPSVRADPEHVRRRALRTPELEGGMPEQFGRWLRLAEETGLAERVDACWDRGGFEALPEEPAVAPDWNLPQPWHERFRSLSMEELRAQLSGRER